MMHRLVAIIGDGEAEPQRDLVAEEIGALVVRSGFGLVCGGLGGVMTAACRGAHSARAAGADTPIVAILPGTDKGDANPYADLVLPTGLGYARNVLVVLAADAVIAIGGHSGTLSEMAHAWQLGKPLCAFAATPGWAASLAGQSIDDRRTDVVFAANTVADVEAWLAGFA